MRPICSRMGWISTKFIEITIFLLFQDWVTATDIRIVFPAMAMLEQAQENAKKSEISIDLEASQKLPRLDLIRNEKLVAQNSSSFFDQDDVFGSGDGVDGFDDEDNDDFEG